MPFLQAIRFSEIMHELSPLLRHQSFEVRHVHFMLRAIGCHPQRKAMIARLLGLAITEEAKPHRIANATLARPCRVATTCQRMFAS